MTKPIKAQCPVNYLSRLTITLAARGVVPWDLGLRLYFLLVSGLQTADDCGRFSRPVEWYVLFFKEHLHGSHLPASKAIATPVTLRDRHTWFGKDDAQESLRVMPLAYMGCT